MGRIRFKPCELVSSLSEVVGYKSGLALSREVIVERLSDTDYLDLLTDSDNEPVRVGSDEFQSMFIELLYRVGNIPSPRDEFPTTALFQKYKGRREKIKKLENVIEMLTANGDRYMPEHEDFDTVSFLLDVSKLHGVGGVRIALDLIREINAFIHRNPWAGFRLMEWKDTKDLADLFGSESLTTFYGTFLDQRFIDYLYRNFDQIDRINWRKFERLAAEFFDRSGLAVEIGSGRNDGNIDVRVWPKDNALTQPPLILVQCKREKRRIGKVVVKALYADILDEGAKSGLIVTTTSLSPGAEKVCKARGYPIAQADRSTLRDWIEALRSPGTGVFLGV